jgi:hypothetical protein
MPSQLEMPRMLLVSGGFSLPPQEVFDTQRDLVALIFSLVLFK